MAYPAAMEIPNLMGFRSKTFDLNNAQQITPSGVGYIQTLDRTSPMWFAEYTTGPLNDECYDDSIAFILGLDGSANTFLAFDPRRPMPRAYQHLALSADPWTRPGFVAPRILDFDYTNSTLHLDQMADNAIITSGDYVSVRYAGIWYLFRSRTNAIANTSGEAVIEVRPRPMLPDTYTPTEIRYRKACAEMKMLGKANETDSVGDFPIFSFKAVQFVNRSLSAEDEDVVFIMTEAGFIIGDETGAAIDWED